MTIRLFAAILLQLIGIVVIIAEFILPSAGILTVVALGVFGYSLFLVFTGVSTTAGFIFVAADIVLIPILVVIGLKLLARSPAALRTELSSKEGVSSQSSDAQLLLSKEGVTVSTLRPSGVAQIEGQRVDVVTRGEFVDKRMPVVVIAVTGNQVIVEQKETQS